MDEIHQIKPVFCSRATQNNRKLPILRILGGVLWAAAALKGHELLTTPIPEEDIWSSRWFLILQTEAELVLGLWFLSGLFKTWARRAGWGCFGLFCLISFYKGITGAESCGCFGRVHVNPWLTLLAIDFPALIVLLLYPQGRKSLLERISPKLGQSWVIDPIMVVWSGAVFGILWAQFPGLGPLGYEPTKIPGLFIRQSTINLGQVRPTLSITTSFEFFNKSPFKLTLGKITSDYDCAVCDLSSTAIEPGSRLSIPLTIKTAALNKGEFRRNVAVQFENNETKQKNTLFCRLPGYIIQSYRNLYLFIQHYAMLSKHKK